MVETKFFVGMTWYVPSSVCITIEWNHQSKFRSIFGCLDSGSSPDRCCCTCWAVWQFVGTFLNHSILLLSQNNRGFFFKRSGGCAGAVTRILKKVDGVTDIATDVEAKSVVVTHDASVAPTLLDEKLQKVRPIKDSIDGLTGFQQCHSRFHRKIRDETLMLVLFHWN